MIAAYDSIAGVVRSLQTNDKTMNLVHLKMGQSTVLRFKDDRPKKIVIGNQNYYNIEFVEGTKDVTLQPLGTVSTNLFVYCQKNIYGFLLSARNYGKYDDVVNVAWKTPYQRYRFKAKVLKIREHQVKKIKSSLNVSETLTANDFNLKALKDKKVICIDFKLKNNGKEEINLDSLDVFLTRKNKRLGKQIFVIQKSEIEGSHFVKVRVVASLKSKKGFSLNITFKGDKGRIIINRNKLR